MKKFLFFFLFLSCSLFIKKVDYTEINNYLVNLYNRGKYNQVIEKINAIEDKDFHKQEIILRLLTFSYFKTGDYENSFKEASDYLRIFKEGRYLEEVLKVYSESAYRLGYYNKASYGYYNLFKITGEKRYRILFESIVTNYLSEGDIKKMIKKIEDNEVKPYLLYLLMEKMVRKGDKRGAKSILKKMEREFSDTEWYLKSLKLSSSILPHKLRIGVLLPMSGELGKFGEEVINGMRYAVEEKGLDVDFIYFDSGDEDPFLLKEGLITLINKGVNLIIGPLLSKSLDYVRDFTKTQNIIVISPTATDYRKIVGYDNMFLINGHLYAETDAIANFALNSLKVRNFAILYEPNFQSLEMSEEFKETVEKGNGRVSIVLSLPDTTYTYKNELLKMRQFSPDGIFLPMDEKYLLLVCTQIRYYKIRGYLLSVEFAYSSYLIKKSFGAAEGLYFSSFSGYSPDAFRYVSFYSRFREKNHRDPDWLEILGYDIITYIERALQQPYKLEESLKKIDKIGIKGRLFYGTSNFYELISIFKIENQEIVRVK